MTEHGVLDLKGSVPRLATRQPEPPAHHPLDEGEEHLQSNGGAGQDANRSFRALQGGNLPWRYHRYMVFLALPRNSAASLSERLSGSPRRRYRGRGDGEGSFGSSLGGYRWPGCHPPRDDPRPGVHEPVAGVDALSHLPAHHGDLIVAWAVSALVRWSGAVTRWRPPPVPSWPGRCIRRLPVVPRRGALGPTRLTGRTEGGSPHGIGTRSRQVRMVTAQSASTWSSL